MKTIFYLLDELTVDIIIDRRLMRLLGYECRKLNESSFVHQSSTSDVLNDDDDTFFDQLIDLKEVLPIKETPTDNYSDPEVEYVGTEGDTAHDSDAVLEEKYTVEGDSMAKALFRSTFETTNSSTKTGDNDHKANHTYDPYIDHTIGDTKDSEVLLLDQPLNVTQSTQLKKYLVVDNDDYILDEFANHTYGDTLNENENPNELDEELKLDAEDSKDLVKLPRKLLKRKPLNQLYKHTKFINTTAEMELELLYKYTTIFI